MRITKRQLRRIIREEKARLLKEVGPTDYATSSADEMPGELYVNLTLKQEQALNNLETAMAACAQAGCSSDDVWDTVRGFNLK